MIILGIDGANYDTLIAPAQRGALPNIESLLQDGIGGTLWSRTTSSAAAWTCHLTGVNPEYSGITGFTKNGNFVRTSDIKIKTYPELLDEEGIAVGLINIPLTYPPLKLEHGFCISGQITPLEAEDFGRPPEVQTLVNNFNYEVDIQYGNRQYAFVDNDLDVDRSQIRKDVLRVENKRIKTAKQLMTKFDWDVFFILINGTDPLQHYYWHEMVEAPMEKTTLFDIYSIIDNFIGYLRSEYPEEDYLLFSDHGFQRDVWGSKQSTRDRWSRIRELGGRLFPNQLKETRARGLALDLLAGLASITTKMDDENEWQHTGGHHPEGAWVFGGPSIDSSDDDVETQFLDLPATILHTLDQPIPNSYEGNVRTDILKKEEKPNRRDVDITINRYKNIDSNMEEQLAHLGYVEMVED